MYGSSCGVLGNSSHGKVDLRQIAIQSLDPGFSDFQREHASERLKMNITSGGYNVILFYSRKLMSLANNCRR